MGRSFNADAKRQERESADVTIGGQALKPAAQTTELRAELRRLGQRQAQIANEAEKVENDDTLDADAKVAKGVELDEKAERLMYEMIAVQLTGEGGGHPDADWLADELAPQDAAPLIGFLQGEEDTTADPS